MEEVIYVYQNIHHQIIMKILTISGSARNDSSNAKLLDALPNLIPEHQIQRFKKLHELPLFHGDKHGIPAPKIVQDWLRAIDESDAMIICTPEYIHNLPALVKNALEWVTASGELVGKKVLAMTFTPTPPRGKKAMQSLVWSLQALDANIVVQLPLYKSEISFNDKQELEINEHVEMLIEAIQLLG